MLTRLRASHPEITLVWADSAYAGGLVDWTGAELRITIGISKRPPSAQGFVVVPRRWAVEICRPDCTRGRASVGSWPSFPFRREYQPGGRVRRSRSAASSSGSAWAISRCAISQTAAEDLQDAAALWSISALRVSACGRGGNAVAGIETTQCGIGEHGGQVGDVVGHLRHIRHPLPGVPRSRVPIRTIRERSRSADRAPTARRNRPPATAGPTREPICATPGRRPVHLLLPSFLVMVSRTSAPHGWEKNAFNDAANTLTAPPPPTAATSASTTALLPPRPAQWPSA
jgi:hypothetical protein